MSYQDIWLNVVKKAKFQEVLICVQQGVEIQSAWKQHIHTRTVYTVLMTATEEKMDK